MKQRKARVLAFYLPQYHPIPENDAWWGKGFTEWTNVGKAKPMFHGHYQPHVPADLGYYDLRLPEVREAQAQMALEFGIEGFVYWHYWFGNGKQLLERPFKEVLESGHPDFPFALAWANESWSGSLHGLIKGKTLIEQTYPGDSDYILHFDRILPAFQDKRYITCDGKPIFLIYKYDQIPDIRHFITLWRNQAAKNNLPGLYFIAFGHNMQRKEDTDLFYDRMMEIGFDGVVFSNLTKEPKSTLFNKIKAYLRQDVFRRPYRFAFNDSDFITETCKLDNAFPTMIPNWDHTPRSGVYGSVMIESTPDKFRLCVKRMVKLVQHKSFDHRFVFLKSWNEWGEGNYVEPDLKYGYSWLKAIRDGVTE